MTEILDKLNTFTVPRLRIIQRDSLLNRNNGVTTSLESLARDVVLVTIIINNSQERRVGRLLDRLGDIINWRFREILFGE